MIGYGLCIVFSAACVWLACRRWGRFCERRVRKIYQDNWDDPNNQGAI